MSASFDEAFVDSEVLGEEGAFDADVYVDARTIVTLAWRGSASSGANDIFEAARRGDVGDLHRHFEAGADLNACDAYAATPLYYACLCGHEPAARYLLERGATCSIDDWAGERCHYAALSDDIRGLLRLFEAANRARGPLFAFSHRHFNNAALSDVAFETVDGCVWRVHRVILCARSAYFRARFAPGGSWHGRTRISLGDSRMDGTALGAVLSFLYTERLLCPRRLLPAVAAIAANLKLPELRRFVSSQPKQEDNRTFLVDLGRSYRCGDPVVGAPGLNNEGEGEGAALTQLRDAGLRRSLWDHTLHAAAGVIPEEGVPPWDEDEEEEEDLHHHHHRDAEDALSDVIIVVRGVPFYAHRLFISRCPGLEAALRFQSGAMHPTDTVSSGATTPPVLRLNNVSPSTFVLLLQFLYADVVPPGLPCGQILEALAVADSYFLTDIRPPLVKQAVAAISLATIVDLLAAAELMHLRRLSVACARFAARNLDALLQVDAFRDLVMQLALAVAGRQATDSLPVVDDIRTEVSELFGSSARETVVRAAFAPASSPAITAAAAVAAAKEGEGGTPMQLERRLLLLDRFVASLGLASAAEATASDTRNDEPTA